MKAKDKLKNRRLELELTLEEVGNMVGVSKSTVLKWETGYIENMKRDKIKLLAKALRVSPLWIMGIDESESEDITDAIPVIKTIKVDSQILAKENIIKYVKVDPSIKTDFIIEIKDKCMKNIGIYPSDLAFIHQQDDVKNGEIAAVLINDRIILRRYYKEDGMVTLIAENIHISPETYTDGEIKILGKVIGVFKHY